MTKIWNEFWFRAASPHDLIAARIVISLTALWIVLSRPLLPDLVRWPAPFWMHANALIRIRYAIVPLPFAIEMALYVLLICALITTAAGLLVRSSAFTAGMLLYHFAPFEDIFSAVSGPYFRGLTLLLLALLIIAFAGCPKSSDGASAEHRWPVALIQLLLGLTYLMSGFAKLRFTGLQWATGASFESIVLSMMTPGSVPPWSHYFLGRPAVAWAGALSGVFLDFFFILAVFSRRAARVIIPIALLLHILIVPILGVVFLDTPALLLFVNWEWLRSKVRGTANGQIEIAETA